MEYVMYSFEIFWVEVYILFFSGPYCVEISSAIFSVFSSIQQESLKLR